MVDSAGFHDAPGLSAERTGFENEFLVHDHNIAIDITLDSTAVDSGSSPTTLLRKGLVLGRNTSSGKYFAYDDTGTDGREVAKGILNQSRETRDRFGDVEDTRSTMVIHGHVDQAQPFGLDAAARVDLADGITFEDDF